ncbi:MAG: LLM class flavin-dependent oxidoreductase [Thermomicrobiales bacterium]|nr:LLM class flavin-dependent oxidoreductase [Thermomicrobiales bacterium]
MGRGFAIAAAVAHDVTRIVAREAEIHGYTSFWVNDTPGADGLAALAAAAEVTEHIRLGVGVVALDRRSPESIAEDVARLNLPQDRLWLGVGSGADRKGLSLVRNGVEVLHQSVTAPIIVGALGPKMSALAGEASEGVLFNWLTPSFAETAGTWVTDAAAEHGKPRPALIAFVRCALLPQAEARLEQESGRYGSYPKYAAHFQRMGVDARGTTVNSDRADVLQAGIAAHEAVLDEVVVRAITADDSAESILELLRACAPPAGGE